MDHDKSGRARGVAVVTGASAGIGKVICEHLLRVGYEVIAMARRATDIVHPKLHSVCVDLTDRQATAKAVAEIEQRFEIDTERWGDSSGIAG